MAGGKRKKQNTRSLRKTEFQHQSSGQSSVRSFVFATPMGRIMQARCTAICAGCAPHGLCPVWPLGSRAGSCMEAARRHSSTAEKPSKRAEGSGQVGSRQSLLVEGNEPPGSRTELQVCCPNEVFQSIWMACASVQEMDYDGEKNSLGGGHTINEAHLRGYIISTPGKLINFEKQSPKATSATTISPGR